MLTPVRRRSLSDSVFEQLRDQIVSGKLGAGTALPAERALCEMLGVNRGALREALKRLEQAQLVEVQHGGATTVRNYLATGGLDLLSELLFEPNGQVRTVVARSVIEMRSALAPDLSRLAALRADAIQKRRINQVVVEMSKSQGELAVLQTLATDFWQAVVEASGNVAYRLAYNTMNKTYEKIGVLLVQVLADELCDLAAYQAIAKAIERGDTAKAEKRASELVAKGGDRMLEMLETLEAMATQGDRR
jgi:GntR family transcriptional regulator, transcriptional repressor for pyruvate dehydrogenase complex